MSPSEEAALSLTHSQTTFRLDHFPCICCQKSYLIILINTICKFVKYSSICNLIESLNQHRRAKQFLQCLEYELERGLIKLAELLRAGIFYSEVPKNLWAAFLLSMDLGMLQLWCPVILYEAQDISVSCCWGGGQLRSVVLV